MAPNAVRKIRLKRSIIMGGNHAQKGEVYECPAPLAHELVGSGSAEYHEDHAAAVAKENQMGVTVHAPHHNDPEPRKIADAPPRPKAKTGGN
ncbi:MAG: hypothetical protein ABSE45_15005 [Candidatus Acidiferrales bacterium]|jgi:hypothetical protein